MVEIALAGINSFASPAPTADFIQALLGELQALREEVAQLQEDNQGLKERLITLESRQTATQKRVSAISDVQDELCDKINEHATALNTVWKTLKTTPATTPKGEKTLKRITALEDFLKARCSGATFHEVEKHLDISPSELTRLIAKIDKRRFEIFARSGDNREKVIRLKIQIR
jgi:chromosome segregation ATPase